MGLFKKKMKKAQAGQPGQATTLHEKLNLAKQLRAKADAKALDREASGQPNPRWQHKGKGKGKFQMKDGQNKGRVVIPVQKQNGKMIQGAKKIGGGNVQGGGQVQNFQQKFKQKAQQHQNRNNQQNNNQNRNNHQGNELQKAQADLLRAHDRLMKVMNAQTDNQGGRQQQQVQKGKVIKSGQKQQQNQGIQAPKKGKGKGKGQQNGNKPQQPGKGQQNQKNVQAAPAGDPDDPVCWDFQKGFCKRGEKCKWKHVEA